MFKTGTENLYFGSSVNVLCLVEMVKVGSNAISVETYTVKFHYIMQMWIQKYINKYKVCKFNVFVNKNFINTSQWANYLHII